MKTIITLLFLTSLASFGQTLIRINAGSDTVVISGSQVPLKVKATLDWAQTDSYGTISRFQYTLVFYNADNNTLFVPPSNWSDKKKAKYAPEQSPVFEVNGNWLNTSTKILLTDTAGVTPKAKLSDYLRAKEINSFPGVSNGSHFDKLNEGVFKELIAILQSSNKIFK